MEKKILLLMIAFSLILPSYAESWDDFSNLDRMWDGQKSITNQEFEQVMEKLEEKGKQKEEKQVKKKRKKFFGSGTTLHNELNPDINVQEIPELKSEKEDLLVNIPVQLVIGGKLLERGYFKVLPEIDEETGKKYVSFYQSQFFKGKIEVTETEEDYGEDLLDFAKIIPYNESFVKLIFGSIKFNAYAFIPFIE